LLAAVLWLTATASAFAQDVKLEVSPAELKIIANAMAAHPSSQTQALILKLQAQIDAQFPPGPFATDLPLPAIVGRDR
jgi:hypothetical protein